MSFQDKPVYTESGEKMHIYEVDKNVRHYIYSTFAKTGRPPTTSMIAAQFGLKICDAEDALERLAAEHQIALAPGSYTIWMAHPFSAMPTDYVTRINGKEYSGN